MTAATEAGEGAPRTRARRWVWLRAVAAGARDEAVHRRIRAQFDHEAATAMAVGGADYVEHRRSARASEMVVRFRIDGERFECTGDAHPPGDRRRGAGRLLGHVPSL